jgi:hypothetical protein
MADVIAKDIEKTSKKILAYKNEKMKRGGGERSFRCSDKQNFMKMPKDFLVFTC